MLPNYDYIQQKDCTAELDAGGIWEIPYTVQKLNQVDSSYTFCKKFNI